MIDMYEDSDIYAHCSVVYKSEKLETLMQGSIKQTNKQNSYITGIYNLK